MLLRLISKKNKYYYQIVSTLLIVLIGFVITFTSLFVAGYYQFKAMNEELQKSAKTTLEQKEKFLFSRTNLFKNFLLAIDTTSQFQEFIQANSDNTPENKKHTTDLMMAISQSIPSIMQFRFIDAEGYETIRIDRKSFDTTPFFIDKASLQNKAGRYYFKELKEFPEGKIWFSNLDLNIEHREIQKPIVPTLRVAKAYYTNNEFKGMLIINIFMQNILHELMTSELFNVTLIDKHSHVLTSSINNTQEWEHYLEYPKDIDNENTQDTCMLLEKQSSRLNLSSIIHNKENLVLVIEEKDDKLMEYTNDILKYIVVMGIIIFIISFPIAIFLSRYPLILHKKLEVVKDELCDKLQILDTYVYSSRTDIHGTITDVSQAFCELSGYTRSELIGQKHSLVKSSDTPPSLYTGMWNDLLDGKKWTGIIKNTAKDNTLYWIRVHITPELKDNTVIAFTAISQNITDQVRIEEISIKDELTQAYNRRHFNRIFPNELKRAKRNNTTCSIAMFDIDHFKKYNDTYGHLKGDEVLQEIVQTVLNKLHRPGDYLFRVGGEEFIVLSSDIKNHNEAQKFSIEIVKAIEDIQIEHTSSDTSDVLTISLGQVTITPTCTMREPSILQEVDNLLYKAKDAGRNQSMHEVC